MLVLPGDPKEGGGVREYGGMLPSTGCSSKVLETAVWQQK